MKGKNLLIILIATICFVMILVCFGVIKPGGLCANQNQENITRNVQAEAKPDVNISENGKGPSIPDIPDLTRHIDNYNFPEDPRCCWRLEGNGWVCGPC